MELPEQFKKYDYLINIIRKLIDPNYLKTKEEYLKWFIYYQHDKLLHRSIPPSSREYFSSDRSLIKQVNEDQSYYFDIKSCKLIYFNAISKEITSQIEVTEQHIFDRLHGSINIGLILIATLNPTNEQFKQFLEMSAERKKYPIDKNCLFEMLSFNQIQSFATLFMDNLFVEYTGNKYIIIKNNHNNCEIKIFKMVFNSYCHFNDIVDLCEEDVNIITVPFSFSDEAARYFVLCLTKGKFIMPEYNIKNKDYEQFKQLMIYFQVVLS